MNPPDGRLDVIIVNGRPLWRIFYGDTCLVDRNVHVLMRAYLRIVHTIKPPAMVPGEGG